MNICSALEEKTLQGKPYAGKPPHGTNARTLAIIMSGVFTFGILFMATADDVAWMTSSGNYTDCAFTNATYYALDGAALTDPTLSPSQSYGVKGNRYLYVVQTATAAADGLRTFAGGSFVIGATDSQGALVPASYTCTYDLLCSFPNGLVLRNGTIVDWGRNDSTEIDGAITVEAPDTLPFGLGNTVDSARMTFRGPISGDTGAALWCYGMAGNGNATNNTVRFVDDALSGFFGTISVYGVDCDRSRTWSSGKELADYYRHSAVPITTSTAAHKTKADRHRTLISATGSFPGTLNILPGARLGGDASDTVFTVSNLVFTLSNELHVAVAADASSASRIAVEGTLEIDNPVAVKFSGFEFPDKSAVTAQTTLAPISLPLLTAPEGVTLDPEKFVFVSEHYQYSAHLPKYHLAVAPDANGRSTLYLRQDAEAIVRLNESDGWTASVFSFGDSSDYSRWSNEEEPSDKYDYLVNNGYLLKTLNDTNTTARTVFKGRSLTLAENALMLLQTSCVRVDDLRLVGAAQIAVYANGRSPAFAGYDYYGVNNRGGTIRLEGSISVSNDSSAIPNFICYPGRALDLQASISGHGKIQLKVSSQKGSPNPLHGHFGLFGDNSHFSGIITTYGGDEAWTTGLHVYFRDANALGGPKPSAGQGLYLTRYARLHPLADVTLDEMTRRIFLGWTAAAFDVTNDVTFTVKQRIDYNANLFKFGKGTLALGGPAPFFQNGNTANKPPVAGKNGLVIAEGTLTPVSAKAFNGLAVVVSNGAHVVVNVPASNSDGDIGQYGMYNVRNEAGTVPFTFPEGFKVEIGMPAGMASLPRGIDVPILTIADNESTLNTLRNTLQVGRSPVPGYAVSLEERNNGDGTVTFVAHLVRGFVIMFK